MHVGDSLLQLVASDVDGGEEGKLHFSISDETKANNIYINSTTGELYLSNVLDYENTTEYRLIVLARDSNPYYTREASTLVNIMVEDVNDNKPMFTSLPSTLFIGAAEKEVYFLHCF